MASDAVFLRQLWANKKFMHEFHRLAPPLPTSDLELAAALEREFTSPIELCPAAH
jgi:hypothetical protein